MAPAERYKKNEKTAKRWKVRVIKSLRCFGGSQRLDITRDVQIPAPRFRISTERASSLPWECIDVGLPLALQRGNRVCGGGNLNALFFDYLDQGPDLAVMRLDLVIMVDYA